MNIPEKVIAPFCLRNPSVATIEKERAVDEINAAMITSAFSQET